MVKRMLIDATHPEEIRVVVLDGNALQELDVETSAKKQLKGNIYLAKVTRVEPSLQAAFVDYGGNRHGFLAFGEIHPDYYQIPVADREALIAEQEALAAAEAEPREGEAPEPQAEAPLREAEDAGEPPASDSEGERPAGEGEKAGSGAEETGSEAGEAGAGTEDAGAGSEAEAGEGEPPQEADVDTVGGDETEEFELRRRMRLARSYKIQEVIKRRQILLVQVAKEERGTKGAALTTFISLAGRYCVLMPNTIRGGGISRKITSHAERKRMRAMLSDLDLPRGMSVILRTAGLERSKAEIKRDFEYLLRTWDGIREKTLKSVAPSLIYEEANLIKRAIRDLYARDIDEVLVDGDEGYREAKAFMKSLMPSHARRIQQHKDETIPIFHRFQVESQLDQLHSPVVQLKSGGYIVINPTEALVAIDVNSGRATRERNIEETALKTNVEAADEVARQLRLRDLAGLIVIDFIDMDQRRNVHTVERRLKEALKSDRARIQVGRISPFGLLEMSRQRLRPGLHETAFDKCRFCSGTGVVRSIESTAVHVLRGIEEEGIRRRASEIAAFVPGPVALYILNQKRERLRQAETRYGLKVSVDIDPDLIPPNYRIERLRAAPAEAGPAAEAPAAERPAAEERPAGEPEPAAEPGGKRRRRRRRRKGRRPDEAPAAEAAREAAPAEPEAEGEGAEAEAPEGARAAVSADEAGDEAGRRRGRRRGRRGGRRRGREGEAAPAEAPAAAQPAEASETPWGAPGARWAEEARGERPVEGPPAEPATPAPPARHEETAETRAAEPMAEPAGEAAPGPAAPVPTEPVPAGEQEPKPQRRRHPPRTGWWQRLIG
ncbi:MAG: Rne/Rng family ribonuclease [Proteobacteria bacterium]|nr:Rne/Rng family ribonuclease [Pseudomonadota bacterium]